MSGESKDPIHYSRVYRRQISVDKVHFHHNVLVRLFGRIHGSENEDFAVGRITWEPVSYHDAGSIFGHDEFSTYEISLDPAEAQSLMDDLYRCGVRPTDTGESVGALNQALDHIKTLKEHVEWLRRRWEVPMAVVEVGENERI